MNILQLEYFLTLSELRSFRKTADALYVSQPAVSMQIAHLEKEWGVQLFFRKYKEAILTPAGEIMYNALRQSSRDFKNALSHAQHTGSSQKTLLNIGIPEYSKLANLFDILSEFQNSYTDVMLNIESAPIAQLELDRANSKFDMVISHEYNLSNHQDINSVLLAQRRHVVIFSSKYPLAAANPELSIADLSCEKVYIPAPEPTSLTVDYCNYICARHGFTPKEVVLLPNVNSVLLAIKMGFGIAVLDDLVMLPEDYNLGCLQTDVSFNLHAAWRRDNAKPFLEKLAEVIRSKLVLPST